MSLCLLIGQSHASIRDVLNATCRIVVKHSDDTWHRGSGTIYKIDKESVYIITAGHLINHSALSSVNFYVDGEPYPRMIAVTYQCIYKADSPKRFFSFLESGNRDFAIIKMPKSQFSYFKKSIPKPIPLANDILTLADNGTIISAGCPNGDWPTAFIGHIESAKTNGLYFQPKPHQGRSGSGIFDISGEVIVGIVLWRLPAVGYGINHRQIHKFIKEHDDKNKQKD